jgi:hypothetical protein
MRSTEDKTNNKSRRRVQSHGDAGASITYVRAEEILVKVNSIYSDP